MPLRVLYIGNFKPSWSTENHVRLALESLGHAVVPAQEDERTPDDVHRLVQDSLPDFLMWTRTWGLYPESSALMMLQRLEAAGVPTVQFHLDLYAPIARREEVGSKAWWRCKYAFTPDGGSELFWSRHGVRHFWLPAAVHHAECVLAEPEDALRCDVAFVGTAGEFYHPEWAYRGELLDWLGKTYGSHFQHFGAPGPVVRGDRLNRLFASAKVIVGDSLCIGFTHPRYWSDRVYETLGRGGFLIHPFIEGMQEHFSNEKHLVFYKFRDWCGLRALIDRYLDDTDAREAIRRAGHEHAKANHTYRHRMEELIRTLALLEPRIAARMGSA